MPNLTGRPIFQKQGKPKRDKASRDYMRRVKELPCVICGKPGPSDAHHVICDRYGTDKASDYDTIPLCRDCHMDGPNAIHRGKASWVAKYGPDHSYLEQVRRMLR